jgi:hypothetical protein
MEEEKYVVVFFYFCCFVEIYLKYSYRMMGNKSNKIRLVNNDEKDCTRDKQRRGKNAYDDNDRIAIHSFTHT